MLDKLRMLLHPFCEHPCQEFLRAKVLDVPSPFTTDAWRCKRCGRTSIGTSLTATLRPKGTR